MVSILLSLAGVFAQAPAVQPAVPQNPNQVVSAAYVPERVYDTGRGAFTDFEAMLAELAKVDVVFVGEQHGDPNSHRLEAALLQGLLRRGVSPTISLEMFERDAQAALAGYLSGDRGEDEFLASSRPWPRYASDYKPLVEMARAHRWPVLASNVPRRLAQLVAREGKDALASLPDEDRPLVAADLQCPEDAYFERFTATMGSHPVAGEDKAATEERMRRYYWSQCLKDETMAESIVAELQRADRPAGPIVHYNGAFHSDFGHGAAERVRRRLPGRRVVVVSLLPVEDIDGVSPTGEDLKRADYLVYTVMSGRGWAPARLTTGSRNARAGRRAVLVVHDTVAVSPRTPRRSRPRRRRSKPRHKRRTRGRRSTGQRGASSPTARRGCRGCRPMPKSSSS